MANYKKIAERHQAVRVYLKTRIWARRGAVLTYRPGLSTPAFTTDSLGFRRSTFGAEEFSVDRSIPFERFSAVMGSSHVFGFGLPGNQHTIPSRFADTLGHPVLNVSLPEANTSDLFNAAKRLDWAKMKNLILFPGGSFTRFCYSGVCSPMDGPPPIYRKDLDPALADKPDALDHLIRYQLRHIQAIAEHCAANDVRFFIVDEDTFFEKPVPSDAEFAVGLGAAAQPQGQARFDRHKVHIGDYRARLFSALKDQGHAVLDFPPVENIEFIDEFHYDAPSIERIVAHLADKMGET